MQDLIWDAVPTQRKKKEELFATPVMSMSAIEKVGAGRKFSFNKAAQELLQIVGEDRITFGFTPDGKQIFIRKESDETKGFKLTQTCTISDKKTYEFVAKRLSLNTDVENHFDVIPMEGFCELVLMGENKQKGAIELHTTDLGKVSEEADLAGDTASLPEVPEGGATYEEDEVDEVSVEEEIETATEEVATLEAGETNDTSPAADASAEESTDEVW